MNTANRIMRDFRTYVRSWCPLLRANVRGRWIGLAAVAAASVLVLALVASPVFAQDSAPGAPQNLIASALSPTSVQLSWDDPGDSSITGYAILRRDPANQAAGVFETIQADTGSDETSYLDAAAAPSTRYVYRVQAHNPSGVSGRSNFVNVTTPAAATTPDATTTRDAAATPDAPENLIASALSPTSVQLSWGDPGDSSITGYAILRRDPANQAVGVFETIEADTGSAETSYLDETAAPSTRYVYRVQAHNPSGVSGRSNFVNVTTPDAATGTDGDVVVVQEPDEEEEPPLEYAEQSSCRTRPYKVFLDTTMTPAVEDPTQSRVGYVEDDPDSSLGKTTLSIDGNEGIIEQLTYFYSNSGEEWRMVLGFKDDYLLPDSVRHVQGGPRPRGDRFANEDVSLVVGGQKFRFSDSRPRLEWEAYIWTLDEDPGWVVGGVVGEPLDVVIEGRYRADDTNHPDDVEAIISAFNVQCTFNSVTDHRWFVVRIEEGRRYRFEIRDAPDTEKHRTPYFIGMVTPYGLNSSVASTRTINYDASRRYYRPYRGDNAVFLQIGYIGTNEPTRDPGVSTRDWDYRIFVRNVD